MKKDQKLFKTDGILVVNKPIGPTSRDIVNEVSHILNTKKIGHTGTLDPIASGVLILTIGKCTKLSDFFSSKYKSYEAEFTLGYETDTLDSTGTILKRSQVEVNADTIKKVINGFKGHYMQEVPAYSAVKIAGKKLYEYARNDESVDLPKRDVDIEDINILSINLPNIKISTTVSKGTYIRSLIRDIGKKLNTYATMTSLVRTNQGNFNLSDSYTLDEIKNGKFNILSPEIILHNIFEIKINLEDALFKKVTNGCNLDLDYNHEFIKFTHQNKVVALYVKKDKFYHMYVKFY